VSDDGTEAVARHVAAIAPDLIVTFGPDGMTGHPDHRAVSRWATDAWRAVCPSAGLWYATLTAGFHRRWGALNERAGLWADQPNPPCTASADLARSTRLADDVLDLKIAALEAHASQTRPLIDLAGAATYREWWREESFRDAGTLAASSSHERGSDHLATEFLVGQSWSMRAAS
jgi:LmbE family N-acetylglucosaminyl deacetylase